MKKGGGPKGQGKRPGGPSIKYKGWRVKIYWGGFTEGVPPGLRWVGALSGHFVPG